MAEETKQIVLNNSKAYGYNYASLGDIASQGFRLPKMKTETDPTTLKEYVYYYDTELKEWIRGAEIVIPEMKSSNKAQQYGAAITYARRYTAYLSLGIASDDDEKVETQEPEKKKEEPKEDNTNLIKAFKSLYKEEEIAKILSRYNFTSCEQMTKRQLNAYVNDRKQKVFDEQPKEFY